MKSIARRFSSRNKTTGVPIVRALKKADSVEQGDSVKISRQPSSLMLLAASSSQASAPFIGRRETKTYEEELVTVALRPEISTKCQPQRARVPRILDDRRSDGRMCPDFSTIVDPDGHLPRFLDMSIRMDTPLDLIGKQIVAFNSE